MVVIAAAAAVVDVAVDFAVVSGHHVEQAPNWTDFLGSESSG